MWYFLKLKVGKQNHATLDVKIVVMPEYEVDVTFQDYANPSFESQIETIGKGRAQGILSIEACVEELYGDDRDDEWKEEEVARLKSEQGIAEVEEPMVASDMWSSYQGA